MKFYIKLNVWKPLYNSVKGVAEIGVLGVAAMLCFLCYVECFGSRHCTIQLSATLINATAIGVLGVAVLGNFVLLLYIAIHLKIGYN